MIVDKVCSVVYFRFFHYIFSIFLITNCLQMYNNNILLYIIYIQIIHYIIILYYLKKKIYWEKGQKYKLISDKIYNLHDAIKFAGVLQDTHYVVRLWVCKTMFYSSINYKE